MKMFTKSRLMAVIATSAALSMASCRLLESYC